MKKGSLGELSYHVYKGSDAEADKSKIETGNIGTTGARSKGRPQVAVANKREGGGVS